MEGEHSELFDLRPDPRILPMLGEINLPQWRCIAELIDNSVDGFISAARADAPIDRPEVHVSLPTHDDDRAKVSIRDNGPGMDAATLEHAVRAGWTGNDPIGNLGLFGMGFNIATARLGSLTRVWTTRSGEAEWSGLEIDFDRLMRQRHFQTPKLSRPKLDAHDHGTEVSIEQLKSEQRQWLAKAGNRSGMTKELGRAYSAMLRVTGKPVSFGLEVNGISVPRKDPCIWSDERTVNLPRHGVIGAVQTIDVHLADRMFCTTCWQWLSGGDLACPNCGSPDSVVNRERRIHGWLGVQRFLSSTQFGIDLIRNGRKIEMENKDLFYWVPDSGPPEPEYPIDDPRNRGRLIGEIHIDHCRVTYTKDRFDRNDPAWDEMVRVVKGEGPLQPRKASELGYPPNTSPLYLLFQAFRRSSPQTKVGGCYEKLLLVPDNDRAEEMAKQFHDGVPEYQDDSKWWELVQEADRQLLYDPTQAGKSPTSPSPTPTPAVGTSGSHEPAPAPLRAPMPSLSREYRDDQTGLRWDVVAFEAVHDDPALGAHAWSLRATASGTHEYIVNTRHPAFHSVTLTPLDALLAELASTAMDFKRGAQSAATFADVLTALRDRYGQVNRLDAVDLAKEAELTISGVANSLAGHVSADDAAALFEEMTTNEKDAIHHKMASRSVAHPQRVIAEARFLAFAPGKQLLRFFQSHPELFFDGRYWDDAYGDLDYGTEAATAEARAQMVAHYASLLNDATWLAEQEPADLVQASRERLLRSAMALELLRPSGVSEAAK